MKNPNKNVRSLKTERFPIASDTNVNVEQAAPIDKSPIERKKTKKKTKKWKSLAKTMKSLLPNMLRGSWRNNTRGEKNASKGKNGSNATYGRSCPITKKISWSPSIRGEKSIANIHGVDMAGRYSRTSYGSNQTDPTFPSSGSFYSRSEASTLHSRSVADTLHSRSLADTLHSRSVAYTDERSNGYQGDAELDSDAESSRTSSEESFIPNESRDNQSESTSSSGVYMGSGDNEVDVSSRSIPRFMSVTFENDSRQGDNHNSVIVKDEDISPGDIKLGRGKPLQRHPGNVWLRNVIAENYDAYHRGGKKLKMEMAKNIVERARLEARQFWKPAKRPGFWEEEIDDSAVRQSLASRFRYERKLRKFREKRRNTASRDEDTGVSQELRALLIAGMDTTP